MSETSATCPIPLDALPAAARRAVDPSAPVPARMMAARGMAPMPPKELVTAQFALTFDADPKVRDAAVGSLAKLDARIANAVLGDTTLEPHVLGYLAVALASRDADVERLLLNPSTPALAFVDVALVASETIAEVIANNQARLLSTPEIARSLTKNPKVLRSTVDRVIDFLVRNNVFLDGVPEFEQALLRLGADDRIKAASLVDIPRELLDEAYQDGDRRMIGEDEELLDGEEPKENKKIEELLKEATTGEKVAYATLGNKAVRSRLLRDSNRVVAMAAITSPRVTDLEVVQAAQSRTVHQDVIGYISHQKDWVKLYPVKVALTNNPKCPLPMAMKLIPALQRKDIKNLSLSKNVPAGVRNLAIKLVKERSQ